MDYCNKFQINFFTNQSWFSETVDFFFFLPLQNHANVYKIYHETMEIPEFKTFTKFHFENSKCHFKWYFIQLLDNF